MFCSIFRTQLNELQSDGLTFSILPLVIDSFIGLKPEATCLCESVELCFTGRQREIEARIFVPVTCLVWIWHRLPVGPPLRVNQFRSSLHPQVHNHMIITSATGGKSTTTQLRVNVAYLSSLAALQAPGVECCVNNSSLMNAAVWASTSWIAAPLALREGDYGVLHFPRGV